MDIKDIAKEIRKQLKKEFPEHKFSVTIDRFSMGQSLSIYLMGGKDDPFDGGRMWPQSFCGTEEIYLQGGNAQLNHYHINQQHNGQWVSNGIILTEQAAKMLARVVEIGNGRNWNRNDIQSDYFDVNYYFDINIGKWNKDYKILD